MRGLASFVSLVRYPKKSEAHSREDIFEKGRTIPDFSKRAIAQKVAMICALPVI